MSDQPPLSRTDVERLATRLGIDVDGDRIDEMREGIASGVDGYVALEREAADAAPHTDRRPPAATIDPGPEADPHNAFLATFDLEGDDSDGASGSLSDLSVALKDNVAVAGVPTTGGSAVFADATPASDAAVTESLLAAGARLVGKTNMDELAYGPTGETSAFGPTENPVAPDRVAGGSSSGSAAAVAAGAADAALGTDTGGSVRIPASFCGLVGVKPTWGAISRFGVIDLAPTLDHVGTLTRDVRTAARLLEVLVGPDHRDPSTGGAEPLAAASFVARVDDPPDFADLSLGVPTELVGEHVDDAVEGLVRRRIEAMADAGATVREVSVPLDGVVSAWNAVVNVEFATVLANAGAPPFRRGPIDRAWHRDAAAGIADDATAFGDVVGRKAIEGAFLIDDQDARHYVAGRNRCHALAAAFAAALEDVDLLVAPTMPTVAPELGDWSAGSYSEARADAPPPLAVNTRPANLAGVPALTLPAGTVDALPVGLQLLGGAGADAEVLAAGAAIERFFDG